jgi:phosphatidylserine/phosphatidylglycerophosphate/cardiolipin synthase-like enzyme
MKWVIRLLLVVLLFGSVAVVTPAEAAKRWAPKQGATFNVPRAGSKQYRIHAQILGAIKHAHKGSTIRIATFSFDRASIAKALIKAHKRGVKVQILLNNHQVSRAQRMLHKALGRNRSRSHFSYECSFGCRSIGENLHTKMYLFSYTGGVRNVVMTGSANLTWNSAINQYNDIWIRNNAGGLYRAFNKVWADMRRDRHARKPYWVQRVSKNITLRILPFPRVGPRHDPIMAILNNVHCTGARGGTGNKVHRTILRVAMHAWNGGRGTYLAKKMRSLYGKGCDVRLMYGYAGADVRATFAKPTRRGYLPVHTTGYDTDEDGFIDLYTHQKELLISGNYGRDRSTKMVVTGSSNWNPGGVKGDEEILTLKLNATYGQYIRDYQFMWQKRSHRVKYINYPDVGPVPPEDGFKASTAFQRMVGPLQGVAAPKPAGSAWESD